MRPHLFLQSEQGCTTSAKSNGFKWKNKLRKESAIFANGSSRANPRFIDMPVEDVAATQIQTAFRAYMVCPLSVLPVQHMDAYSYKWKDMHIWMDNGSLNHFLMVQARKTLRRLKGTVRLQIITKNYSVKKQAATTLNYLHSWSQIQAQIRARRLCMVTESRLRQKKLENQLKLEAKLHDLEVRI